MENLKFGKYLTIILKRMFDKIETLKNKYITPELLAYVMTTETNIHSIFEKYINIDNVQSELLAYLDNAPHLKDGEVTAESEYYKKLINMSLEYAANSNHSEIMISDVFSQMFQLEDSFVKFILEDIIDYQKLINDIFILEENLKSLKSIEFVENVPNSMTKNGSPTQNIKKNKSKSSFLTLLNGQEFPPIIGRDDIIERTIQILARANKNNPIHVGEPGVGKTTIVEALVKKIDDHDVPDCLKNAKVFALNVGDIIAGTQFRGELEARVKKVLSELENEEIPILYIDEIHTIMESSSEGMNIASILKPYLTTGKIKFIGATTEDDYKKIFLKDKAIARRFQKVTVSEPSISETIEIVKGLKPYYEKFHNVKYNNNAIIAAVELSAKYITDRFLPDKAIDLIDEAGAYIRTYGTGTLVKKSLIEEVLSKTCNIPKITVEQNETMKLKNLDKQIKSNLFGQDEAVDAVVKAIKISRAGLMDENKPIASLLMVGPTGVGKTELARNLATILGIGLVKFDMSEYMDKTSVNKLIGASAGYVGYEEGGALVDAIRKQPHCVLLLDEIEKAHPDVFNILLQVMDDATLSDNQGRKADFRNVIILMTSNAGAQDSNKQCIGFNSAIINTEAITTSVKDTFSPEFRNRLTGTIVFNQMDEKMAELIAKKQLKELVKKMPKVKITYGNDVVEYIVKKGLKEREYGGRSIKRVVENDLKQLFVDELLFGNLKKGGFCHINIEDDKFKLNCKKSIVNMQKISVTQTV